MNDNIFALLGRMNEWRGPVQRILRRVERFPKAEREDALYKLLVVLGLRDLVEMLAEEVRQMPIVVDLMENQFFASKFREARERGKAEGQLEYAKRMLHLQLKQRFGAVSKMYSKKIEGAALASVEGWSLRVLEAKTMGEVFE